LAGYSNVMHPKYSLLSVLVIILGSINIQLSKFTKRLANLTPLTNTTSSDAATYIILPK